MGKQRLWELQSPTQCNSPDVVALGLDPRLLASEWLCQHFASCLIKTNKQASKSNLLPGGGGAHL